MARKKKMVEAPAVTEPQAKKHTYDHATVKDAFAHRPKTVDAVDKAMNKLASNMEAGTFQRTLMLNAYFYGLAQKVEFKRPFSAETWEERFKVFTKDHYKDNAPAESALRNLKSATMAFFEASYAPFNAEPIVKEVAAITNVQLGWRSGRIRELIFSDERKKIFRDKDSAPEGEEIEEALAPSKAMGSSGGDKADGEAQVKAFMRDGVKLLGNANAKAYLDANPHVVAWLQPVLVEVLKYRKLDTKAMNTKVAKDAVAAADAVIAAANAPAPTRKRRGASVH